MSKEMREQIDRVKNGKQFIKTAIREFLNEAHLDKDGNLKDFYDKIFYDFDKIKKFVDWFQSEYSDYTHKQGWAIFDSDTEAMADYNERIADDKYIPYPPQKDITTGMWNSEPEWGLSGYGFRDADMCWYIEPTNNYNEVMTIIKNNN